MNNCFVNYAHRGASAYAPENTLMSFYLGLFQGANGIETDVRKTKDGALVLFHDDELDRCTDGKGRVLDYSLKELREFRVFSKSNKSLFDKIVTLETFLECFAFRDLVFAIELKQREIEKETVDMLEKYEMRGKCFITSFQYRDIKAVKEYAPDYRVGLLTEDIDEGIISDLLKIGAEQICPKAETLNAENMEMLRLKGLSVRAWGVFDESLMRHVYDLNADGMTVDFPDKLRAYIKSKRV